MPELLFSLVCVLGLTSIAILLIIFGNKEYRLNKKIELLKHMIDKGYESNKIDLNKL